MPVYPREAKTLGTRWDIVMRINGKSVMRRGFVSRELAQDYEMAMKLGVALDDDSPELDILRAAPSAAFIAQLGDTQRTTQERLQLWIQAGVDALKATSRSSDIAGS